MIKRNQRAFFVKYMCEELVLHYLQDSGKGASPESFLTNNDKDTFSVHLVIMMLGEPE